MADLRKILIGNAPGEFFVDSSCIDCDLCRQVAPGIFREEGDIQPWPSPSPREVTFADDRRRTSWDSEKSSPP